MMIYWYACINYNFQMIAVFCLNEWKNAGAPPKIQVVELGPGKGSLAADMLRVSVGFPPKSWT